ncbi:MAG TPA: radical SAM protein [Ignisphaera sp.]|nr:radical SAM protein [Ignisphaera sp.]
MLSAVTAMTELVINVSNIVSSLCYSLIRLEPYNTCVHQCTYCYARWYRRNESNNVIVPRVKAVYEFRTYARKVYRIGLPPIPARLSTLVDPFIPHEELYRTSLTLLRIALEYEYPVIVNTKSALILKSPWIDVLEKLAEKDLLLLQLSISTLDNRVSRMIEPHAPAPELRLKVLQEFASRNIPVVVRLSPYIPRVSLYPSLKDFVEIVHEIGVKHVIVEALRLESSSIKEFLQRFGLADVDVESYSLREVGGLRPLSRISLSARLREYIALQNALTKYSITFATCKEGLFALHTAKDCCGMYLFKRSLALRPTLAEIYNIVRHCGPIPVDSVESVLRQLETQGYLCGSRITMYPKRIAKPFRYHEKKLLRVLRNPDILRHVAPSLNIVDGKIVAKDIAMLEVGMENKS